MNNLKITNENRLSLTAAAIIILSYAAERVVELLLPSGKVIGILLAMAFTVLLLVVTLLISKEKDSYFGLLAALLGFKMMPVSISFLYAYSPDADMLYYIVRKAAMLIFLVLAFKLYTAQTEPKRIKAAAVLAILYAVPFFTEVSGVLMNYFLNKTGSMLFGYFSQYACYAFATFIILGIAYFSGRDTLRFTADFEIVALLINMVKVGVKIVYRVMNGWHVSASFYGWIALYAALIICFVLAVKIQEKRKA